jgi:hypothetical protein
MRRFFVSEEPVGRTFSLPVPANEKIHPTNQPMQFKGTIALLKVFQFALQ